MTGTRGTSQNRGGSALSLGRPAFSPRPCSWAPKPAPSSQQRTVCICCFPVVVLSVSLCLLRPFSVTQASNLCLSGCQPASTVSGCSSRIGSFWTQCACFHLGQKTNRLPDPTWMLPGQVPPGGRLVPRVAGDPQHNPGDCDG